MWASISPFRNGLGSLPKRVVSFCNGIVPKPCLECAPWISLGAFCTCLVRLAHDPVTTDLYPIVVHAVSVATVLIVAVDRKQARADRVAQLEGILDAMTRRLHSQWEYYEYLIGSHERDNMELHAEAQRLRMSTRQHATNPRYMTTAELDLAVKTMSARLLALQRHRSSSSSDESSSSPTAPPACLICCETPLSEGGEGDGNFSCAHGCEYWWCRNCDATLRRHRMVACPGCRREISKTMLDE